MQIVACGLLWDFCLHCACILWPMGMGPHLHRIHIQLTVAHCLHVRSSFWSQGIVLQPERSMAAQTQRLLVDTVKGKPHAPQQLV